ncbi:WYL domain-containing protein, partial [Burkholderia multivorans]
VEYSDAKTLAAEIVGYGDTVRVVPPDELARAVDRRREVIAEALDRLGGRSVLSA